MATARTPGEQGMPELLADILARLRRLEDRANPGAAGPRYATVAALAGAVADLTTVDVGLDGRLVIVEDVNDVQDGRLDALEGADPPTGDLTLVTAVVVTTDPDPMTVDIAGSTVAAQRIEEHTFAVGDDVWVLVSPTVNLIIGTQHDYVPPVELVNTAAGGTNGVVATPANTGGASGDAFHLVSTAEFTDTGPVVGAMSYRTEGAAAYLSWDVPETNECYLRFYVQGLSNFIPDLVTLFWADTPGSGADGSMTARLRLWLFAENADGSGDQNARFSAVNPVTPPAHLVSLAHLGVDWSADNLPWTRVEAHVVLGAAGHIELRQFTDPDSPTPSDTQTFDGQVGLDTPYDGGWGGTPPGDAPPYLLNRITFLSLWRLDNETGTIAGLGYSTTDWLGPL